MFIPEFWCGVLATIGGEVLAIIAFAVVMSVKKK